MRLIDRLLARADPGYNEYMYSGAYAVPYSGAYGRGKEGSPAGIARAAREAYEANGVVFACELVRMALFSEARFKFQSAADDRVFGNQDLGILEHPWPNATQGELLARMTQDETTAGNCYVRRVEPDGGGDPLLVQMPAECVTIISEEARDTMGRPYRVPVGYAEDPAPGSGRDPEFFTPAEVAHYSPAPDPRARFRGMSWLTPLIEDVRADQAMTTYKTEHLRSGAQLGIVVKYAQKLQPATIDALRERISARYGGPANAGKTLVLDQGGDVTVAGSTLEQLQFTAVQQAGERRVCAAAGPGLLEILGFEKGDYQSAIRKLGDLWARPRWRMACASLEHLVPTSRDLGPVRLWFDVAGVAALREGELTRAQAFLVKTQGLAASVAAGYTRESAIAAADAGDLSLLKPDPNAPPSGVSGRETATTTDRINGRPPQAGLPQDLPGAVRPNLPGARPLQFAPMPGLPNGARG